MQYDISSMNGEELLRELIIINKVRDNFEYLVLHNSYLQPCIENIDKDIKQIMRQLFFKYHSFNKVDLNSLLDYKELQNRMIKYLDTSIVV